MGGAVPPLPLYAFMAWKETNLPFWARSQNCRKRLLALSCLPVRPHRITRLQLDGRTFIKILNLSIFRKSAKKIQVSLKCDKKNGHVL
jgi:hypothetical protein